VLLRIEGEGVHRLGDRRAAHRQQPFMRDARDRAQRQAQFLR
jgi:hypothetical protein